MHIWEASASPDVFDSGSLDVGDGHSIWWSQAGSRTGVPVVMLHAGPGASSSAKLPHLFDGSYWRVIQFDQRGCGRSRPRACLEANTTAHLIADIEALRESLGIEAWLVFGQSWGTALGLAYAQAHPTRCLGLLLSAIYLGDKADARWFFEGPRALIPEAFEGLDSASGRHSGDPLTAICDQVFGSDPDARLLAVRSIAAYDRWLLPFLPDIHLDRSPIDDEEEEAFVKVLLHFLRNDYFIGDGVLLDGVDRIRRIPAILVQGRYDIATSMRPAYLLNRAWPQARLVVVPDGAYLPTQAPMWRALQAAVAEFKSVLPLPASRP